jgi:hypothetical protein
VAGWKVVGDAAVIGGTHGTNTINQALTWTNDQGGAITSPGASCTVHSFFFDSISKTIVVGLDNAADPFNITSLSESGTTVTLTADWTYVWDKNFNALAPGAVFNVSGATLSGYNGNNFTAITVNKLNRAAVVITYTVGTSGLTPLSGSSAGQIKSLTDNCMNGTQDQNQVMLIKLDLTQSTAAAPNNPAGQAFSGHGMQYANIGGTMGEFGGGNGWAWKGEIWNPFPITATTPRWNWTTHEYFDNWQDAHGSNSDYLAGRSALPFVGVLSYTNIQTAPPVNTYTVTSPQETEIDVYVINSVSCPGEFGPYKDGGACVEANSRMYRFVHNYSLRAGAIYPSQAQPQITRDRLWVAFSSTYMGHLGKLNDANAAHLCVTADQCRTDVFLVYLGDAGGRYGNAAIGGDNGCPLRARSEVAADADDLHLLSQSGCREEDQREGRER